MSNGKTAVRRPLLQAGVHVSIAGGLHKAPARAGALNCLCFQTFMGSPRSWIAPVDPESDDGRTTTRLFREQRRAAGLGIYAGHTRYLVNLCSSDRALYAKSVDTFVREAVLACSLEAEFIVVHPGSSRDGLARAGLRLGRALDKCLQATDRLRVLLEPTAQPADRTSGSLEFLGEAAASSERLGLCLDLAHLAGQGYDFTHSQEVDRLLAELDAACGQKKVFLIHGNDTRYPAGSNRDHHQHVAGGALGRKGFLNILSRGVFRRLPWVLETPKQPAGSDLKNLKRLHKLASEAVKWTSKE